MKSIVASFLACLSISCASHRCVEAIASSPLSRDEIDLQYTVQPASCSSESGDFDGYYVLDWHLFSSAPPPVGWRFFIRNHRIVWMVPAGGGDFTNVGAMDGSIWCDAAYSINSGTCDMSVFQGFVASYSWRIVSTSEGRIGVRVSWPGGAALFERCGPADPCWIPIPRYSCSMTDDGNVVAQDGSRGNPSR